MNVCPQKSLFLDYSADFFHPSGLSVFGLGAVGLAVIQGAKTRKAGRIFAIDVNSSKFEVARR